jgi:hypothetical protein
LQKIARNSTILHEKVHANCMQDKTHHHSNGQRRAASRNLIAPVWQSPDTSNAMQSELLPAATKHRSVKVTTCLSRDQLAELDHFCEENELTRSQAVRQAVKAAYRQRVNGRKE